MKKIVHASAGGSNLGRFVDSQTNHYTMSPQKKQSIHVILM